MNANEHERLRAYMEKLQHEAASASGAILTWDDIPWADQLPAGEVSWLVEEVVPARGITLLAGESGCYKTWLALCLARGVVMGTAFLGRACRPTDVLYLDRENPPALVRQRLLRLGMIGPPRGRGAECGTSVPLSAPTYAGPHSVQGESAAHKMAGLTPRTPQEFRLWGGWLADPPPGIGDARLLEIVRARQPLVIFDSLIRFHQQDENSATAMAAVMNELRALANAGATVVVLHHKPKGDGSHYRGSSDIRAAVDLAWAVSKHAENGLLKMACFKNRYAVERTLTLRADLDGSTRRGDFTSPADEPSATAAWGSAPHPGRQDAGGTPAFADFAVLESPAASEHADAIARLRDLIAAHPGLSQNELVEHSGMAYRHAVQLLRQHEGSLWRVEQGERKSRRFFLVGESDPEANGPIQ